MRECFQENGGIKEICSPQQVGGTHTEFTDSLACQKVVWPYQKLWPSGFGRLRLSNVVFLLPGGGHVLPVLHHGHLEHAQELSSGIAVSCHLCIAGDDFEPAGPSAQAQNSATLQYSVLEMSWSLA